MKIDTTEEIQQSKKRIKEREKEINQQVPDLERKIKSFTAVAWLLIGVGFVLGVVGVIIYLCSDSNDEYSLNLLGDYLAGAVSSTWSLAGLFFIYVAFLGQKLQLKLQQLDMMYSQLEIQYTRHELVEQKKEMQIQNETLLQQRFENTFFQLLANHNTIVNSMDVRRRFKAKEYNPRKGGKKSKIVTRGEIIAQGRDCFVYFYNKIKDELNELPDSETIEVTLQVYAERHQKHISDLGHYFRNLYHIVKFVNESDIENKKRYTNFVRAQLSSHELVLLFYNCLSNYGNKKFYPLVEDYELLKNIDYSLLFGQNHYSKYHSLIK